MEILKGKTYFDKSKLGKQYPLIELYLEEKIQNIKV